MLSLLQSPAVQTFVNLPYATQRHMSNIIAASRSLNISLVPNLPDSALTMAPVRSSSSSGRQAAAKPSESSAIIKKEESIESSDLEDLPDAPVSSPGSTATAPKDVRSSTTSEANMTSAGSSN